MFIDNYCDTTLLKQSGAQYCWVSVSGVLKTTSTGLEEPTWASLPNSMLRNVMLVAWNWPRWIFTLWKSENAANLAFYYRMLVVKQLLSHHNTKKNQINIFQTIYLVKYSQFSWKW